MSGRPRRLLRRIALGALVAGALIVAGLTAEAWTAMGATPSGARLTRMQRSPQYGEDEFVNYLPMEMAGPAEMLAGLWDASPDGSPPSALDVLTPDLTAPPASGLRITWLGHSTMLIEIDGRRVLTDPVFSERSGPSSYVGPRRFHPPPIPLASLPPLDAVLISHDHYDHLDDETITALAETVPRFLVPLGVGAHLAYWGVPEDRIVELDWWDEEVVEGLRLVATPARHFSGRGLLDRDATLWASWAIVGPEHRVFFSGDTGMHPAFEEIGQRLGPFDATMLEVGAYNALWRDVHLGPEQAVRAHQLLGGGFFLPIHWGTFNLAYHSWVEPGERLLVALRAEGVAGAIPRQGQSVEPASPPPLERWWPEGIAWQSAEEAPVTATHLPASLR